LLPRPLTHFLSHHQVIIPESCVDSETKVVVIDLGHLVISYNPPAPATSDAADGFVTPPSSPDETDVKEEALRRQMDMVRNALAYDKYTVNLSDVQASLKKILFPLRLCLLLFFLSLFFFHLVVSSSLVPHSAF
jgi:hypothetical protein